MPRARQPKVNVMEADAATAATTETEITESVAAPAPISITDTPEFAIAVSAAVDKALGPILERFAQAQGQPPMPEGDSTSLFRQMALAIAEISDQGTNRKRVAPEVLAKREAAWQRMIEAIIAHKTGLDEAKRDHRTASGNPRAEMEASERVTRHRPKYRALGKMYLNERLIEPYMVDPVSKRPEAVEFFWSGAPNELMFPLNDPAKEIHGNYLEALGSNGMVAKKTAMWVTAGGLTIVNDRAPARREMAPSGTPAFDDDLQVLGGGGYDPTRPFINVLGTVAEPARQNYADSAAKRA